MTKPEVSDNLMRGRYDEAWRLTAKAFNEYLAGERSDTDVLAVIASVMVFCGDPSKPAPQGIIKVAQK